MKKTKGRLCKFRDLVLVISTIIGYDNCYYSPIIGVISVWQTKNNGIATRVWTSIFFLNKHNSILKLWSTVYILKTQISRICVRMSFECVDVLLYVCLYVCMHLWTRVCVCLYSFISCVCCATLTHRCCSVFSVGVVIVRREKGVQLTSNSEVTRYNIAWFRDPQLPPLRWHEAPPIPPLSCLPVTDADTTAYSGYFMQN